jgi:hypothetical protein
MADEVYVNGNLLSWGSLRCKVGGVPLNGFDSISYGDALEIALGWGMGKSHAPRGRSRGKYVPEPAKLRGFKAAVQALRARLAAESPDGKTYGQTEFEVVLQANEPGEEPLTVQLEKCRLVKDNSSHEENADPLKDEVELSVMRVRRNGLVLFDESEG